MLIEGSYLRRNWLARSLCINAAFPRKLIRCLLGRDLASHRESKSNFVLFFDSRSNWTETTLVTSTEINTKDFVNRTKRRWEQRKSSSKRLSVVVHLRGRFSCEQFQSMLGISAARIPFRRMFIGVTETFSRFQLLLYAS